MAWTRACFWHGRQHQAQLAGQHPAGCPAAALGQVWEICSSGSGADAGALQGDVINSVALLPSGSDPYILLGCESGSVRIVAVLDEAGQPAAGGRPAADLALQPYQGRWGCQGCDYQGRTATACSVPHAHRPVGP